MPKRISAADPTPLRVVIVTLDDHLASAVERAAQPQRRELPGLTLSLHAAADWDGDPAALERCRDEIARGDIVIATMLFMEDHIQAVLPGPAGAPRPCDAMIACMSAGEVIRLTRSGRFRMDGSHGGAVALLKRLRGGRQARARAPVRSSSPCCAACRDPALHPRHRTGPAGLFPDPAILARGLRRQRRRTWSASSSAATPTGRAATARHPQGAAAGRLPGGRLYHPRLEGGSASASRSCRRRPSSRGTVGLLVMRSYVLAGDTATMTA